MSATNGNQQHDAQGHALKYYSLNRLEQVLDASNNVLVSYTYDAIGRLIQRNQGGAITQLVYRGLEDQVVETVTSVTQDEPPNGEGNGNTCADAVLTNGAAQVRAERSGTGNGRVYVISFTANDGRGGYCNGSVMVCVPHDQSQGGPGASRRAPRMLDETGCVDDGQNFNSLRP